MNDLPSSWEMADGDDLFASVRGVTYSKADAASAPADGFVPILRANNIADGRIVAEDLVYVPAKYVSPEQYLQAGDLLIATSSGSRTVVGKAAAASDEHGQYAFGAFCTVARPRVQGFGDWLSWFVRTRAYRDYVEQVALGISINNLRGSDLKSMPIRLAPLPEQRRIVAKVDSLTGKSRRARDHLDHIPRLVEKYKQAVLAAALEGLMQLDSTSTLGEMAAVVTSGSRDWAQYYDRGSSVFVLAGNVRPRAFDPTPKRLVDPPLDGPDARRSRIQRNDLLVTIVGAGTGELCRVDRDVSNYFVCQSVALVRLKEPAKAHLLELYFNAEALGGGRIAEAIYGQGRPHLSFDDLRSLPVPDPDMTTVRDVVERIEKAFAWIDRLASEATSARRLIDRLDQAVLAKAFRGELVPQDPEDELASVLLDRIRAERGTAPKTRRGRKAEQ